MPLWEAGAGFTGLSLPEYRGADHQLFFLLPLPYFVYRGKLLRADRKGINDLLFESDRVRLNLSFDVGAPVRNSGNSIRAGMSDLDPTVQIGPSLEVCLVHDCAGDKALQLRLPVRAVYAVKFIHMHGIGLVVNPQISFDQKMSGVTHGMLGQRSGRSLQRRRTMTITMRWLHSSLFPESDWPMMPTAATAEHLLSCP
jgi:MipA family protein